MTRRQSVLFLCVANSARSQMAEGIARHLTPRGVAVHSAGTDPAVLHPLAVEALAEVGVDIRHHRSKGISDIPLHTIDTVIILCAEEMCPDFHLPVEKLHWPLPDPAAAAGSEAVRLHAFREVRDLIRERLKKFFAEPADPSGVRAFPE